MEAQISKTTFSLSGVEFCYKVQDYGHKVKVFIDQDGRHMNSICFENANPQVINVLIRTFADIAAVANENREEEEDLIVGVYQLLNSFYKP